MNCHPTCHPTYGQAEELFGYQYLADHVGQPLRIKAVEKWITQNNWHKASELPLSDVLYESLLWLQSRPFDPWTSYCTDIEEKFTMWHFFSNPADAVEFNLLFG